MAWKYSELAASMALWQLRTSPSLETKAKSVGSCGHVSSDDIALRSVVRCQMNGLLASGVAKIPGIKNSER